MNALDSYQDYARAALEQYAQRSAESRYLLYEAVKSLEIKRVLDVGCGAGQELLPFLEKTEAFCVGVDVAEELGKVTGKIFDEKGFSEKTGFVRSQGEKLPFAAASFDVVLCRVALPYMNNRQAIAEIARVLRPEGVFLLKIHAPPFYFGMIRERWKTFSAKQMAYPLICLAGGVWHLLTGKQLQENFWKGKEVFQTRGFLQRECAKNDLKIKGELSDTNVQTPSFVIVKN